ncbi:MAG TPA: PQQ-dependent sugar dehydrogenase [Verrucomicrobiae bacterium]|nr:PQQ-dependent sugar dehydrogenase [Verrucomicrobiae bacterium]
MNRIQGVRLFLLGNLVPFLVSTHGANLKSELVVKGLSKPVFVVAAPGDTNRLFALEQWTGKIRIIDLASRALKGAPFLTVTNLLSGSEQGLLGLAFHPNYRSNGFFYINQVAKGGTAGHTEISRFQAAGDPATSDLADASSRKLLLSFDQPEANHNGGWMAFGPDGYLYFSQGDGGGANDQHGTPGNGQGRNTYLGKLHRIDVDHGDPYAIPSDNPFVGNSAYKQEIWAFGLRNPWRCSFDRATGDIWIGDVGQDTREEVDFLPAGIGGWNFGWRVREGLIQNASYPAEKTVTAAVNPVYDYSHSVGLCVIGGYVYRGSAIPSLQGKYVFGDYNRARFWMLTPNGTNAVPAEEITAQLDPSNQIGQPSSFGEDAAGEIYICDYADGEIYKIVTDEILLSAIQTGGADFTISFQAKSGQGYALESRNSLSLPASWTTVTNVPSGTTDRTVSISSPLNATEQYFRVRTP